MTTKVTRELIEELKQNGEDREWYPTSKEMIKCIYEHRYTEQTDKYYTGYYSLDDEQRHKRTEYPHELGKVLDIGCGTENFKKYINELDNERVEQLKQQDNNYVDNRKHFYIGSNEYFVIEKSQILIQNLHKDTVVVGTDFYSTDLMLFEVDTIFCNPPYSQYEEWVKRILMNANFKEAYFVIPQRWKDNKEIINIIENVIKADYEVIGNFDFLHAERQARAVVDVVYIDCRRKVKDTPFDRFFNEFYWNENKLKEEREEKQRQQEEKISNAVMVDKGVANNLVTCYNDEFMTLSQHFQCISQLEPDVLEAIGVKTDAVKKALKEKITGLKNKYWKLLFDNMQEITDKLTSDTRSKLCDRFTRNAVIDFTLENIYPTLLWCIKNANEYYNEQLIDFFDRLSSSENCTPYKSNERLCTSNWRYADREKYSHYTLDYRIVCDRLSFSSRYSWEDKIDKWTCQKTISDICVILRNLGFNTDSVDFAEDYGTKYYIYDLSRKPLMEYKIYKNGNVHIKFDIEVMKCLNITVARLLGWVQTKEEAMKEMPDDYKDSIDKYWNVTPCISLTGTNGLRLLGTSKGVE